MGKVDRNVIWEKLAEVELEAGSGLLKVGGGGVVVYLLLDFAFFAFLLAC